MKPMSLMYLALAALATGTSHAATDCAGPLICPAICAPTCGSDGRTYANSCEFTWARDCKNSSLVEVGAGPCPGDKAWNGAICGSDPQEEGSAPGSSDGSDGSTGSGAGDSNATSTPKPETPTVTSPGSAPVPTPSSGAVKSGLVPMAASVAAMAVVVMVL